MNKSHIFLATGLALPLLAGCGHNATVSNVLEVSNTGTKAIDLQTRVPDVQTIQLQGQTQQTLKLPTTVRVGNAEVRIDSQVQIAPLNEQTVSIEYNKQGKNWTMTLAQGGVGYFNNANTFTIDGATFRVIR
ncbi:MAG: hypothetical protein AAGA25_00815 [Planctomycetota bacterium]